MFLLKLGAVGFSVERRKAALVYIIIWNSPL